MAVPSTDPNSDYNSPEGTWQGNHLTLCLTEGIRQSKIKPINYQKLATIHQGSSENPTLFVERLREALTKHTNIDPDSPEGELMLQDTFITQSAPGIRTICQGKYCCLLF